MVLLSDLKQNGSIFLCLKNDERKCVVGNQKETETVMRGRAL